MIRALANVVSGRRSKWVVIAVWVAILAALAPQGMTLSKVTTDETATPESLPSDSQSAEVAKTLRERFPDGDPLLALAVYRRAGGLNKLDDAKIGVDAARIAKLGGIAQVLVPVGPLAPPGLVSRDGSVAFTAIPLTSTDSDSRTNTIKAIRKITDTRSAGLQVHVTGAAALQSDLTTTLQSTDASLLIATALLVLILLIAIYRAPLMALLPLIVVGVSYTIAEGIVHLGADAASTTIDRTAVTLLAILMFGAGTDYCLLMVSRYTSELRQHEDKHEALRRAYVRAAPAIAASGLVVAGALMMLLFASLHSNRIFGPVNAAGILVGLAASLTLLPALLTVFGRAGFWPSRSLVRVAAPAEPPRLLSGLRPLPDFRALMADAHPNIRQRDGIWRRVGEAALKRPWVTLVACLVLLGVCALGVTTYKEEVDVVGMFRKTTDSTEGFKVLSTGFPKGTLYPNTVLVERANAPLQPADVAAEQAVVKSVPGVAAVSGPTAQSKDKRAATFAATFADDPFGQPALDRVRVVRAKIAAAAPPGVTAQLGDGSALRADYGDAASSDQSTVIPLVLLVIGLTLVVLLRALVAPLYLLATVLVSFFATLGISLVVFDKVFGEPRVDPAYPFFAFVFLVALGVDYNIFLMDRVREEAREHGTKAGALRALVATGPVITSAGLILAGTFAVLMTLPLDILLELGFTVALGVLLDTFLVRTLMVPSIVKIVGDASWWPAKLRPAE
ncbi:MAG: putative drug exporter of the superfamily [Thermoleophilaceae bacterium]|nr:putative drug exporter of the superfamily [Thermoleophilaceae bacterium]